ncbi:unnamed protein product, partial [Didymodactylos carnosus]
FPNDLRKEIELGWSDVPEQRCKLEDFQKVLLETKSPLLPAKQNVETTTRISTIDQADDVQSNLLAYSPITNMKWPAQNEKTRKYLEKMINDMRKSSSFSKIFSDVIINAMLQVPRHLFVDMNVFKENTKLKTDEECMDFIYAYSKALRASGTQNMSSTEITCAQLCLVPLNAGDRALFLGAK